MKLKLLSFAALKTIVISGAVSINAAPSDLKVSLPPVVGGRPSSCRLEPIQPADEFATTLKTEDTVAGSSLTLKPGGFYNRDKAVENPKYTWSIARQRKEHGATIKTSEPIASKDDGSVVIKEAGRYTVKAVDPNNPECFAFQKALVEKMEWGGVESLVMTRNYFDN